MRLPRIFHSSCAYRSQEFPAEVVVVVAKLRRSLLRQSQQKISEIQASIRDRLTSGYAEVFNPVKMKLPRALLSVSVLS